jgi:2-C-methyl-D-erythritol 4-phosphate cytidylyltransferase
MTVAAIVPAAGEGRRLDAGVPKALVPVGGRTLLEHAVGALRAAGVDTVVVAAPPALVDDVAALLPSARVVPGGETRQDSVRLALAELDADVDIVLVHDAARALVPADVVRRVLAALAAGADAVIPVVPLADTVKEVDADGVVLGTVDRAALRAVQTPQGFRRTVLERAHAGGADAMGVRAVTDDAALCEAIGVPVATVDGSAEAFKVTTPFDLAVAESVVASRVAHV